MNPSPLDDGLDSKEAIRAALDRCRLPHPLLGPLTVREMLRFTLCHHRHLVG